MNTPITLAQALRQAGIELEQELPPPGLAASVSSAVQAAMARPLPTRAPGACRAWGVEAKLGPSEDSFCRVRRPMAIALGQERGVLEERRSQEWTAAAKWQPTLPKPDRLLARPVSPPTARARRWAWSGATACVAVVLVSVALMLHLPTAQAPTAALQMSSFVPVVPPEQWPAGDAPAWLVSTELRRDRLAALGLPFDPARAGESVPAELLVRASGEVLAVRFVQ